MKVAWNTTEASKFDNSFREDKTVFYTKHEIAEEADYNSAGRYLIPAITKILTANSTMNNAKTKIWCLIYQILWNITYI